MEKVQIVSIQKKGKNYIVEDNLGNKYNLAPIVVMENFLKVNKVIDLEDLEQITYNSNKEQAWSKVIALVSVYPKTKKQLKEYMVSKGYQKQIIDEVIAKCEEYGYINDLEYAKAYISMHSKNMGNKRLEQELKQKGVSNSIIEELLLSEEDQIENAVEVLTKWFKTNSHKKDVKIKASRFLYARGYTWSISDIAIRQVIGQLDTEDYE